MKYDFDTIIDRRGTSCLKYDFAEKRGYPKDILPLWVADMDFRTAPEILQALHRSVDHGIFGYTNPLDDYKETVIGWYERRFDWKPEKNWLVNTPGVVFAICTAIRAFTREGDAVLIQPPVYYPFFSAVTENGRVLVENELVRGQTRYEIDFDDFEEKIRSRNVKMFILCSPHNPVGRVWTQRELQRIGEICGRYNVIVVSDEIHSDFVYEGHHHTIFTQAAPELADRSVICTSPSKSFNMAGLQVSNIWIKNNSIRAAFKRELSSAGYSEVNALGLAAAKTAYSDGEHWFEQCLGYIKENLDFTKEYLKKYIPQARLVEPEGTYFAWIDFSALKLGGKPLDDLIVKKAGLWLDSGRIFGEHSETFQRIVLACPKQTLASALDKLRRAIETDA